MLILGTQLNKPKVLIFIENDFTLRSYLETPVLESLKANYSLEGVLSFDISAPNAPSDESFVWHKVGKNSLLQVLQTVVAIEYWFRNQQKSNSFRIRILSLKESRRVFYSSRKNREFPSISIYLGFLFAKTSMHIPNNLLWIAARSYRKLLVECEPNVVICVTSGGATSNSDILALAGKKLGFPVLTITENWDNLTSKAVFSVLPDYLGVWGSTDKVAAENLHGFVPERIFTLGSPRVSQLFQNQTDFRRTDSHILFAGGSIDVEDDLAWFNQLIEVANQQNVGLVYVPHPSNYNRLAHLMHSQGLQISNFIPAQILDLVTQKGDKRYPKLSFYDDLLSHSALVVSPYSTLLLESLLLGIPTIGLDFQDPKNFNLGWASDQFEHLQGLDFFANYIRVRTQTELSQVLGLGNNSKDNIFAHQQFQYTADQESPFYDFSETFAQKIQSVLRIILGNLRSH
jgi:hypothetical protein